jgi:hypothetical protein
VYSVLGKDTNLAIFVNNVLEELDGDYDLVCDLSGYNAYVGAARVTDATTYIDKVTGSFMSSTFGREVHDSYYGTLQGYYLSSCSV